MPVPPLTEEEWRNVRRRVFLRAIKLSKPYPHLWKVEPRAQDLAQQAIAKALEPDAKPWDPARHQTFVDYLCDIVWSLHGHEMHGYRLVMASHELTEEMIERGVPGELPREGNPLALLLRAHDNAISVRRRDALAVRVKGDTLIELLLAAKDDRKGEALEEEPPEEHEVRAPNEELQERGRQVRQDPPPSLAPRPNAEPASTRAALAKGYSLKDIKNARERLKRHAEAVVQEEAEVKS